MRHQVSGQVAAIKQFAPVAGLPSTVTEALLQRFQHEASLLQQLQAPGLARWLDGSDDPLAPWMAIESLPRARDLSQHARPGRLLPLNRLVQIGIQACRVLQYLHDAGWVHRDVKPANLLLAGERPFAFKLLDLGLACPVGHATGPRRVLGSPQYMSPEQAQGLPLDGRSDLYSLGVTLHELVRGQPPYPVNTLDALLPRIVHEPLHWLGPEDREISPDFASIIGACLRKQPSERPQSAGELGQRLLLCLKDAVS